MTLQRLSAACAMAALVALAGCSGSSVQSSLEPPVSTPVNPATQTKLQFAVGTAVIAGAHGLNTLETFRQSSGANAGTSVLENAPTITGPAGFVVPATTDAYADAGKNTISGTLVTSLTSPPPATTFNPTGGTPSIASSYGFLPSASTNSNTVPNEIPASLPYYAGNSGATQYAYIGGPPAFVVPGHTSTQDGTFTGTNGGVYPGLDLGFVDFDATPVAGSYGLSVVVPTGINSSGVESYATVTTTATLTPTYLPAWSTPPTFSPDGTGGGTISLNFAAGGGITEEYVELVNVGVPGAGVSNNGFTCQKSGKGPYYYTFEVTPGTATVTVPDSIGAAPPNVAQPHTFCTGAENTAAKGATTAGDGWQVYGFAVDYPLIESDFPASLGVVAPTLTGASGQTDLTTSAASGGNVP